MDWTVLLHAALEGGWIAIVGETHGLKNYPEPTSILVRVAEGVLPMPR